MVQSADTLIRTHGLRTQPRPSHSGRYFCPVPYIQILRLPFVPVDGVGKSTLITSLIKESFVANVSMTCRAETKGHNATAIVQELPQACQDSHYRCVFFFLCMIVIRSNMLSQR